MKNKKTVLKEYSTALLTIGSMICGVFNCLCYYVYDIWAYAYIIGNFLIFFLLLYLCWRVHDKFSDEEREIYVIATTVVIPFAVGSYASQCFAI